MKVSIITITILFIVIAAGHAFGQTPGGDIPWGPKPTDGGKNPTAGKGVRIGKVIFKAASGNVSSGTEAEIKRRPRPPYGVPTLPRKPGPVIKLSADSFGLSFQEDSGVSYYAAKKRRMKKK